MSKNIEDTIMKLALSIKKVNTMKNYYSNALIWIEKEINKSTDNLKHSQLSKLKEQLIININQIDNKLTQLNKEMCKHNSLYFPVAEALSLFL